MPVAVEINGLLEAFQNQSGMSHAAHQQRMMDAFVRIDEAVMLIGAMPRGGDFLRAAHIHEPTFGAIGDSFLTVGGRFRSIAGLTGKLDELVVGRLGANAVTAAIADRIRGNFGNLGASLERIAAELETFGRDFLGWNKVASSDAFRVSHVPLRAGVARLIGASHATGAAFGALGEDFQQLSNLGSASAVLQSCRALAQGFQKLASQCGKLSRDFHNVADIFSGQGGGAGRVADVWSGQGGGAGRVADIWSGQGGGAGRVADIFSGQGGGSGRVADIFSGQGGGSGRVADIWTGQGGGAGRVADIYSGQGGGAGFGAALMAVNLDFMDIDDTFSALAAPIAEFASVAART